jgi:hypothetical protein
LLGDLKDEGGVQGKRWKTTRLKTQGSASPLMARMQQMSADL